MLRCQVTDKRGKAHIVFELEVCQLPRMELIGKDIFLHKSRRSSNRDRDCTSGLKLMGIIFSFSLLTVLFQG